MRTYRWLVPAILGAVLINGLLMGLASFLSHERDKPEDLIDPVAVSLVKLAPPEPPQPEEVEKLEKPETKQKQDFQPDLVKPQLMRSSGDMDVGVVIDLGNVGNSSIDREEFVFEAYELDQPPQTIVKVPPVYPYKAREQGIEGIVQIKVLVNTDGTVGKVQILGARPEGFFEKAVMRAVPNWKFNPGKIEGNAVTAWVVTNVRFQL
ncbi:MAG: TonB family protein [Candidatus Latescibacteria bacterium]|nr:TonB family protein [bacterium]MBD3423298.1 TonB family protein [Candidatus Latescibacterota bacterium]